jgi:hypothetical protein
MLVVGAAVARAQPIALELPSGCPAFPEPGFVELLGLELGLVDFEVVEVAELALVLQLPDCARPSEVVLRVRRGADEVLVDYLDVTDSPAPLRPRALALALAERLARGDLNPTPAAAPLAPEPAPPVAETPPEPTPTAPPETTSAPPETPASPGLEGWLAFEARGFWDVAASAQGRRGGTTTGVLGGRGGVALARAGLWRLGVDAGVGYGWNDGAPFVDAIVVDGGVSIGPVFALDAVEVGVAGRVSGGLTAFRTEGDAPVFPLLGASAVGALRIPFDPVVLRVEAEVGVSLVHPRICGGDGRPGDTACAAADPLRLTFGAGAAAVRVGVAYR